LLIGAYGAPSVPKEIMNIRLCGALLCGGLLVLAATTNSFAQSGRNNTVQGNYIGTSRGVIVSPYQTGGHGGGEGRRRSNASDRMGGGGGKGVASRKYGGGSTGDNDSPRPQDRKANKAGLGTGKPAIFDRWGRTEGGGARRTNVGPGYPHENTGDGRRNRGGLTDGMMILR
jgi:hypothetical protein